MTEEKRKPYCVLLRLPQELGRKVKRFAGEDQVSINSWLLSAVARSVGICEAEEKKKK